MHFRTYESTPSGAPRNVRSESEGIKSIVVRWEAVPDDQKSGDILGYTVPYFSIFLNFLSGSCNTRKWMAPCWWIKDHGYSWRRRPCGESVGIASLYQLSCLRVGLYDCWKWPGEYGTQFGGDGRRQWVIELRFCFSPLCSVLQSLLSVPGIPSGVAFSLVSEDEVRLKWLPPENPNGKIKSYTITYWLTAEGPTAAHHVPIPSSSLGGFTAAGRKPSLLLLLHPFPDLKPNSKYTFAIAAETSVGVGREAEVQVVTTSVRVPVANPPVATRDERSKYSSNMISIRWDLSTTLDDDEAPVRFVQVEYQKANDENWTSLEKNIAGDKGGVTITRLSPNSVYRFRIRYISDFAQSLWSPESEWMRTLPAAPQLPPNGISASPYDSASIQLQWQPPIR